MIPDKPLPFLLPTAPKVPQPKIAQRGGAERMTIVAGFTGAGGAILCADDQETVSGYSKRKVEKIHVWKPYPLGDWKDHGYNLAIAGSSESGPYADSLTNELHGVLKGIPDFDLQAIGKAIENCLTDFYQRHIWPRTSQAPAIEMLVAVQDVRGGHANIFHTSETAVNLLDGDHCCIGVGSHLADYILQRTLAAGASLSVMIAVAAYMLKEVQDNIEGCGEGVIWWFDTSGNCDLFWDLTERQKFLEGQTHEINAALAATVAYMTAVGEDATYHNDADRLLEILNKIRANNLSAYERHIEQQSFMERALKMKQKAVY